MAQFRAAISTVRGFGDKLYVVLGGNLSDVVKSDKNKSATVVMSKSDLNNVKQDAVQAANIKAVAAEKLQAIADHAAEVAEALAAAQKEHAEAAADASAKAQIVTNAVVQPVAKTK